MQATEKDELVTYLGRAVPRRGFRAFIYSTDGKRKLTESWDEFELFTHSDTWFATPEEAQGTKEVATEAPKKPSRRASKPKQAPQVEEQGAVEVIEEDFLPNDTGE